MTRKADWERDDVNVLTSLGNKHKPHSSRHFLFPILGLILGADDEERLENRLRQVQILDLILFAIWSDQHTSAIRQEHTARYALFDDPGESIECGDPIFRV
jgi:hypothetical protein